MNITKVAIENNRVTIVVLFTIILMGIIGYNNLSRDSMPPFTVRVCNIVTSFPGASPERVEKLITDKVEKAAQELPELKTVTSESRTGLSIVTVTLNDDIKKGALQPIWDRLRRKIDETKADLPDGIYGPNVKDDGIGVVYGIQLGLIGDGFSYYEVKQHADDLKDELIKLDDASEVEISGDQTEQIYLEFDNASLAKIGLTAGQLQSILAKTNIVIPGGEINLGKEKIVLEPTGNFESIEDLKKTIINLGQGQTVTLGEIVFITRTYKSPADSFVRIDGEPGLSIAVALKDGANLIELGNEIDIKVKEYQSQLPLGLKLKRIASADTYVDFKVKGFISNVYQSVAIVLIVMLFFLGIRTGIVVSSLIPFAMIMTIFVMSIMEVGLNQVSLAALIMALGMLVDNAIVVIEAVMVKMEKGETAKNAAIKACNELMVPLLVSSLTTSVAFLAFYLAENSMGEMMAPLFIVITIALICSWILAMTVIPLLASNLIKIKKIDKETAEVGIFDKLGNYYRSFLEFVIKRSFLFILFIIGLFFGSLMLFGKLPFIFFPDSDRNLLTMNVNLPLGTKIEETQNVVKTIENYILNNFQVSNTNKNGIVDFSSFISDGPKSYDIGFQPGEANSSFAHLLLNTSSFDANDSIGKALNKYCFENFPDAEIDVAPLAGGGGGGSDIEVRIAGDSPEVLYELAKKVKQKMFSLPGSKNIKDDWGGKIKKFVIDIDQDKANRAGLTNQDIAASLSTALSGFETSSFRDGEDNIPIVMRSKGSADIDALSLESLAIFSQSSGQNVPLTQVAEIIPDWQYAKIKRRDLFRTMVVSCDAKVGFTANQLTTEIDPWLVENSKEWKNGYTYELGGESEESADSMGAVIAKLPIAAFIIILLLISQFNSIRKTTIVLSTIPLGVIGVIVGLLLFKSYFGFMAFLGVISLAGIVINNAIVLLDRIEIERTEFKKDPYTAILDAAQQRFRPIILTTFTTTLGMIPLYLGGGLMWEPMAISIMVGLLFATVITLLFVPAMYKLLFRVKHN